MRTYRSRGEWLVMERMKTYIIAEAGVNHNGNLETALKLCDAAKSAGANAVKFQTWITEKVITKNVRQADYQINNTGNQESQFDMLKKLELPFEDFKEIKAYCDKIGIDFASTADEPDSLDFLLSLDVPFIKIGSGDIGNIPFLRYIGKKSKPIILSTGMSNIEDIEISINALQKYNKSEISLLHCTTSYPCPLEAVNLKAITTLKEKFGLPVGYSDHTLGIEIPIAAVAMGATIIEKHFTLDKNMKGPDHIASIEPDELNNMVCSIRNLEIAIGNGLKIPTNEENIISQVVLKKIVAKHFIKKGSTITEDDITVKRAEKGITAKYWDKIVGSKALKDYGEDEVITI